MGTVRYHFDTDDMVYARIATGYRPGGTNCAPGACFPGVSLPFYSPDRTTNYEIGLKGQMFDRRLQLSMAAFYINWKSIQLDASTGTSSFLFIANGGRAASKGFEGSAAYSPGTHWQLAATLDYTDAHLTEDASAVGGLSGDQLPGAARWTASFTADYVYPLADTVSLLAGAAYRYRDWLANSLPLSYYGSERIGTENVVDVQTGLRFGHLEARVYGRNIFNNRSYAGYFGTDLALPNSTMLVPVQARTVGLGVDYRF